MDAPTDAPNAGVTEPLGHCSFGSSLLSSLGLSLSCSLGGDLPLNKEEDQDKEDDNHDDSFLNDSHEMRKCFIS